MPLFCLLACGSKPRKKHVPTTKGKMMLTQDFRRADPNYVNFVPRTCADAIDLFMRHQRLGLKPDLYPECFVHCAKELPDLEIDKFHRWLVQPSGDITSGGEKPTETDAELEAERKQLLAESETRDAISTAMSTCSLQPVPEEKEEQKEDVPMLDDDFMMISQG